MRAGSEPHADRNEIVRARRKAVLRSDSEDSEQRRQAGADGPVPLLLPTDLLLPVGAAYERGELLGSEASRRKAPAPVERPDDVAVEGVRVRRRILVQAPLWQPEGGRSGRRTLRRILRTCAVFDPLEPCRLARFRQLVFRHRLFRGTGEGLLRWLGIPPTHEGCARFVLRLFSARLDGPDAGRCGLLRRRPMAGPGTIPGLFLQK